MTLPFPTNALYSFTKHISTALFYPPVLFITTNLAHFHMMEAIKDWYNGNRDYSIGISLYAQYGTDRGLLTLFNKGETPFSRNKLTQELLYIYKGISLIPPEVPLLEGTTTLANYCPKPDPVLEGLYNRKITLHKEKDLLRHTLESLCTDADRGLAAHRIIKIRELIVDIWYQESYYNQNGQLPTSNKLVTDPGWFMHRKTIVNGNIRRLRSLLKKDPENEGYLRSMDKYSTEYEDLKKKIKEYKASQ